MRESKISKLLPAVYKSYPSWARWLAQDADGAWWAYEVEPLQYHQGWYENELGRCLKLAQGEANACWQQTLYEITGADVALKSR